MGGERGRGRGSPAVVVVRLPSGGRMLHFVGGIGGGCGGGGRGVVVFVVAVVVVVFVVVGVAATFACLAQTFGEEKGEGREGKVV